MTDYNDCPRAFIGCDPANPDVSCFFCSGAGYVTSEDEKDTAEEDSND